MGAVVGADAAPAILDDREYSGSTALSKKESVLVLIVCRSDAADAGIGFRARKSQWLAPCTALHRSQIPGETSESLTATAGVPLPLADLSNSGLADDNKQEAGEVQCGRGDGSLVSRLGER